MTEKAKALIVAAGASSRMGVNKMLLPWGKSTMLGTVINNVSAAELEPVVVVGCYADEIISALKPLVPPDTNFVVNVNWAKGRSTSIQVGLRACEDSDVLIFNGDMPQLGSELISAILFMFENERTSAEVLFPVFKDMRGHPVWVSKMVFPDLLSLEPQESIAQCLFTHTQKFIEVPYEEVCFDIDTLEDYVQLKKRYDTLN